MRTVKQLSTFLVNEPDVLSRVCASLAEAGIDIRAISVTDTVDHAVVRLILDDPGRGLDVLEEGNLFVVDNTVIEIPLADRPGALAELSGALAHAGINIEYLYGSTPGEGGQGVLFLRVRDLQAAEPVVASFLAGQSG